MGVWRSRVSFIWEVRVGLSRLPSPHMGIYNYWLVVTIKKNTMDYVIHFVAGVWKDFRPSVTVINWSFYLPYPSITHTDIHSRVVRFHPGCGMTFRKSPLQNYLMEIDNPILRSENGVTEVAYPIFMSENGVMEVANPILTIEIAIMEVMILRVRCHGSRDRKFITQKKVLEIANPIFDIKMRFWKSPSLFLPPWTRFWKSPSKFSLLNWPTWR